MRKIVSLGLFALILSIFSSQVFAGKVLDCEEDKDELKIKGSTVFVMLTGMPTTKMSGARFWRTFVKKAGKSG